jgi:DNA-directed RNA polymerase specialized sigma24 family protein
MWQRSIIDGAQRTLVNFDGSHQKRGPIDHFAFCDAGIEGLARHDEELELLRMSSHKQERSLARAAQHASPGDFCTVFHRDMDVLYWLALTLTSDENKAEQCFVAGLEECIEGNCVFKEWARSWSRRVVIKNAIRLMSPAARLTSAAPVIRQQAEPRARAEVALATLPRLTPFERFVYVMSVLEGYTDRDCATLLGCSSADVAEARLKALTQIKRAVELSPVSAAVHGGESRETMVLYDTEVA